MHCCETPPIPKPSLARGETHGCMFYSGRGVHEEDEQHNEKCAGQSDW